MTKHDSRRSNQVCEAFENVGAIRSYPPLRSGRKPVFADGAPHGSKKDPELLGTERAPLSVEGIVERAVIDPQLNNDLRQLGFLKRQELPRAPATLEVSASLRGANSTID